MKELPHVSRLFQQKKSDIVSSLALPEGQYQDLSPKGTIDDGIRGTVNFINSLDGMVTTSSCAGRLAVFKEGEKPPARLQHEIEPVGGPTLSNGKGGGTWIYVSHRPVLDDRDFMEMLQLQDSLRTSYPDAMVDSKLDTSTRFVKLQFEPMILHVIAASLPHAQLILSAAFNSGMRESGVQSLGNNEGSFPVIAIRSNGLALSSIIGFVDNYDGLNHSLVSERYLKTMIMLANSRFQANTERIARFNQALKNEYQRQQKRAMWETRAVRAARKREEGLTGQKVKSSGAAVDDKSCNEPDDVLVDMEAIFQD